MINPNPITDAKFDAVQELVDKQDYTGARILLRGMDDPMAREWERKIDALQPPPKVSSWTAHVIIAVIAFMIGGIALIVTLLSYFDLQMDYSVRPIALVLAIVGFVVAYVTNRLGKR
jgi:VIT1/CCC1 family predicted Fe2+/Mn2+ transporter